jgi:hypothetical protein
MWHLNLPGIASRIAHRAIVIHNPAGNRLSRFPSELRDFLSRRIGADKAGLTTAS